MPKSSFVDFKAVKSATSMEQVLAHYDLMGQFKKSGDSLSGPCPIHKGDNPTQFRVSISKNIWNCFSECKGGGNVLDFIAKMENVSIHAAAIKAIEWFGLDTEVVHGKSRGERGQAGESQQGSEPSKPVAETKKSEPTVETTNPNPPLKFRLEKLEHEHPYLKARGLTLETILDFGVGYCTKGMMAERIAIPIHNVDGQVVAYAGRWPGELSEGVAKYKVPQGFRKSMELFNLDRAIKEPSELPLVVVEGFFGCMMLHQIGCRKVVALMGSNMSARQEQLIHEHTKPNSQVIVMLDEDEAGRAGREDIAARLVKFLFVKIQAFDQEGQQPDTLSTEQVAKLFA